MIHIGKDNHENHGTGLCFRQECADVRELMAGLRAIHTFYEKNEGMITGN